MASLVLHDTDSEVSWKPQCQRRRNTGLRMRDGLGRGYTSHKCWALAHTPFAWREGYYKNSKSSFPLVPLSCEVSPDTPCIRAVGCSYDWDLSTHRKHCCRPVKGEDASSHVFLEECGEESGRNTAEQCACTHLHLSNSERKQRKVREESKRNWYSFTDVLSADPVPMA